MGALDLLDVRSLLLELALISRITMLCHPFERIMHDLLHLLLFFGGREIVNRACVGFGAQKLRDAVQIALEEIASFRASDNRSFDGFDLGEPGESA